MLRQLVIGGRIDDEAPEKRKAQKKPGKNERHDEDGRYPVKRAGISFLAPEKVLQAVVYTCPASTNVEATNA